MSAIAFFAPHMQLRFALRALLVPGFLFWLARLAGFAGGLKLLFARFVGQLNSTLRMDAVFGIRRLSTDRARFGFSYRIIKCSWLFRHHAASQNEWIAGQADQRNIANTCRGERHLIGDERRRHAGARSKAAEIFSTNFRVHFNSTLESTYFNGYQSTLRH